MAQLRIGVFPHADLPHVLPCFRLCRALAALGHETYVLGSDVQVFGRGHSEAWRGRLDTFGLRGRDVVHRDGAEGLVDWLLRTTNELRLDVLVVDAVWQGLAWGCRDALAGRVVVHHAGLPDFRTADMPSWYFVHPDHPNERHDLARGANERREAAGEGIRGLLASVKALSAPGRAAKDVFAFGCGEFENVPAVRAMSAAPATEFPGERGRVAYFGSLLPRPGDMDRQAPPASLADLRRGLVACVFGTSGLRTDGEYAWLLAAAADIARRHPDHDVVAVVPEGKRHVAAGDGAPRNLSVHAWIPLWELLASREGPKALVTTPGAGAFREATASGTPIVAVPRALDQFGMASRVDYFGIGAALVSRELPAIGDIASSVDTVLGDAAIRARARGLREEIDAYEATRPLARFVDELMER